MTVISGEGEGLRQYRPATLSAANFRADRQRLYEGLREVAGTLPWSADLFNPYPCVLLQPALEQLAAVCEAVAAGIRQVVGHYARDERIRARLRIDPRLAAILGQVAEQPYRIGTFRPDFLIDTDGVARLCEINARFTANGFMISHFVNAALEGGGYLPSDLRGVAAMRSVPEVLSARWRREGGTVALVLASEMGDEIHALLRGIDSFAIAPEALACGAGGAVVGPEGRRAEHFIVELDRRELLRFEPAVLRRILARGSCRNDVRSLILVHDKRLLSILGDPAIMGDYLEADQCARLARHVIPTWPATDTAARARALADPAAWVLKRNHGGRGLDMLVGHEAEPAVWAEYLTDSSRIEDYTLQRFVEQRRFPILHLDGDDLRETAMNVVGLLPCFEGTLFGPGIFRAATGSIINVHQRRGEILPCAVAME